ncbi:ORF11A [Fowl aviadenovirus E]|uniref:ORF11A n=1 Tax=Fowl aviadenovirus E TaxID=190065 RepID=E9KLC9_9ADEN|nr:ORF11A [Fowl aviadenovirus E]ADE58422.1 ORF11A [Fowl aviadenovirus E]
MPPSLPSISVHKQHRSFPTTNSQGEKINSFQVEVYLSEMTTKTFSVRVTNKNALVSHTQLSEGVAADDG